MGRRECDAGGGGVRGSAAARRAHGGRSWARRSTSLKRERALSGQHHPREVRYFGDRAGEFVERRRRVAKEGDLREWARRNRLLNAHETDGDEGGPVRIG